MSLPLLGNPEHGRTFRLLSRGYCYDVGVFYFSLTSGDKQLSPQKCPFRKAELKQEDPC